MSLLLFDFECERGHRNEFLVASDVRSMQCLTCGALAHRIISPVRSRLEGITGAFPGAAMAWEKRRESHMAKERKNMERHGTYK